MKLKILVIIVGCLIPLLYANEASFNQCVNSPSATTISTKKCLDDEIKYQNKILNKRYNDYLKILNATKKSELRSIERDWISFRDKKCDFFINLYGGGTIDGISVRDCQLDMIKQRSKEIEELLSN